MSKQESPVKAELGLRARKKQETRLAISTVATRLFIERGFDAVTVAEVAAAANVSVNTVFNYFSTKEELFFDRGAEFSNWPSQVIGERRRGESAVGALRRAFRKFIKNDGIKSDGTKSDGSILSPRLEPFLRTMEASPALLARERLLLEASETALAASLARESGSEPDDPKARAVAALITSVEALLLRETRRGVLAQQPDAELRLVLSRLGEQAFELLMAAAGDYCARNGEAD